MSRGSEDVCHSLLTETYAEFRPLSKHGLKFFFERVARRTALLPVAT
jgi:hypothetical protein